FTGDLRVYRKAGSTLGAEAARVRLGIDMRRRKQRLDQILTSGADLGIYTDVPISESDETVAVSNVTVNLPARNVLSLEEAKQIFDNYADELASVRDAGASEEDVRAAVSKVMRANIQLSVARLSAKHQQDGKIPITAQSMRIGEVVLVSIPVEPFAEIAVEVKKRSPSTNTVFSGFSNGHINYLPTDIAFEEGGYEVGVSVFAPGSADLAIEASLEAIENVFE
ncbi:MAG: hypothetical protein VW271_08755, partial [Chloroflexota bacterium]